MTCLGPYVIQTFLTLYFIVPKFCVFSMSNYLNAYKQFVFILRVALWNVFLPLRNSVVYLHFTGYQMKA